MGKKGSWFSAIKRVFTPHSKEKESDKRNSKDKKWKGIGKLRHGETNSFIPLFREPSSIEKILGEAEREHKITFRPPTPVEQPTTPPFIAPRAAFPRVPSQRISSPKVASPRASSPRVPSARAVSPPRRAPSPPPRPPSIRAASPPLRPQPQRTASPRIIRPRPEPTLRNHHASATKIQAAFRGYMARRSFRALKGLVRLQGVVRGQNVKRQTVNAMKYMQLLVRVQSQIQSRRIQMLENQARYQAKNDKETDSKWASEAGNENWDDSLLTKEEREARLQRKVNAVIKRERAMAYAYSHQLWKANSRSAQGAIPDIPSATYPWWWNWLERQQLPSNPSETQVIKNFQITPPRPVSELKPSPRPASSNKQYNFGFDTLDTSTPKSTKSTILPSTKFARTPPSHRLSQGNNTSAMSKYSKPRGANSQFEFPAKDDDSLTSCPPFSAPNYMTPTVSAKAKARATSNPRERFPGTPSESKRRLSFPLTQGIGSFKWNKGSFFSGKDSSSQRGLLKNQSIHSIGNVSVDSTVSMPATVGKRPFNRFV